MLTKTTAGVQEFRYQELILKPLWIRYCETAMGCNKQSIQIRKTALLAWIDESACSSQFGITLLQDNWLISGNQILKDRPEVVLNNSSV